MVASSLERDCGHLAESKSDSVEHFGDPGVPYLPAEGQIESTGRKTALAAMLAGMLRGWTA
jgi:hypothetical protein